jgi:hypothetical protein
MAGRPAGIRRRGHAAPDVPTAKEQRMDHHTEQAGSGSTADDALASSDDPSLAPESGEHGAPGTGSPSAAGAGIGGTGGGEAEDPGSAPESADR